MHKKILYVILTKRTTDTTMADFDWDDIEDEIESMQRELKPVTVTVTVEVVKDEKRAAEEAEREKKRQQSIAARRAERDMLDAERKQRQAAREEEKRKEEELANNIKVRAPTKTPFEEERDEFISKFVRTIKEADLKSGKGHLWIGRNRAGDRAPKLSKGEVDAQTKAMYAWKTHTGL